MPQLFESLRFRFLSALIVVFAAAIARGADAPSAESLWIEAEHLRTIEGYCWPMGRENMVKTNGHWGLSGPGWAAEWNQGGESGFLSIAAGPGDDKAEVSTTLAIPTDGDYVLWVRYGDWREAQERFEVTIEQAGLAAPAKALFGDTPAVDEDNEAKLYWGWAFVWRAGQPVKLKAGEAKLTLRSAYPDAQCRQVDCMVLTTDASYRPLIKDRPANDAWRYLQSLRSTDLSTIEPLARRTAPVATPASWKPRTFKDKGFLYLWNVGFDPAHDKWLSDDPARVLYPYNIASHNEHDKETRKEFEQLYAGKTDVPIFSDPRIVPTFHAVGPKVFQTDSPNEALAAQSKAVIKWLDADPNRLWATMMNYHPDTPLSPGAYDNFMKYRDRYVGSIAGESLGYIDSAIAGMKEHTAHATTRREVAEIMSARLLEANATKYRTVLGKDLPNAYADVISCLSVGNIAYMPLCGQWGARTIGYESAVATATILNMRWAFIRGCARQWSGLTATYRSSNFGDSATMYSATSTYSQPKNLLDNYYSVFSGAGATWYKFDIWYQYMAGSSMFYHEQGFDEFWKPGGTTAAGLKTVQLSPKGKLVDRFLRTTAADQKFDRGTPFTPVAFLLDYAHGWEPSPYWPSSFKGYHGHQDRLLYGDHEKALQELFWTAYYPIGPQSEKPITALSEVFLPGVYGDVFDVIFAYPDTARWTTIDTYPVVIVGGEIAITEAEGDRLAQYVEKGGTLLVADAQLTGPGAAALNLPAMGAPAQARGYKWMSDPAVQPSQQYAYRLIKDGTPVATTPTGETICSYIDRGNGRLIVLSVPRGLGVDRAITPMVPRLLAHLTAGQMPVRVEGEVQWLVNRTDDGRYLVTLINPFGQDKPQQGITPTNYRENRNVVIHANGKIASAVDRLLPTEPIAVDASGRVNVVVSAGSVRVMELALK